jgi:hypothetical protein
LTASPALAALTPEQAEARLEASLANISGQPPRCERAMIPEDGRPIYRVIEAVVWSCPAERYQEAAAVLEDAFRAAPERELAAALYRLRLLTRGREQRELWD